MFRRNQESGFTVIELTLAMGFVAFILLFTTVTTIQMMKTYNKGVTIKQVNQAGRTLTEDLSRSLSAGKAVDVNLDYLSQGKLCIGSATYVWKPVYVGAGHTYNTGSLIGHRWPDGSPVTLARASSTLCRPGSQETLPSPDQNNFSLLGDQARVLDVAAEKFDGGRLVKLTFTLGTFDLTEEDALKTIPPTVNNIYNTPYFDSGNLTCRPGGDGNFCAFGTFQTTVYVGN